MPRVGVEALRKAQVIQAVRKCVAESGLHGATVRAVAAKAGVSTGILNYYFESREDLIEETLRDANEQVLKTISEATIRPDNPLAKLQVLVNSALPLTPEDREINTFWVDYWAEAMHSKRLREAQMERNALWWASIEDTIREGQRGGVFRRDVDARAAARTISALIDGLTVHTMLDERSTPASDTRRLVMDYIATALLPAEGGASERVRGLAGARAVG
jgi:AcrR family transcriptional regulator